jgi:DNA-binding NarL/FixJ family response regulator
MAAKGPVSNTQIEILCLVNRGLSNQEIADKLSITVDTTKWHLHQIFRKLEVHNRTAAAALPGAARRVVEGLRQLRRA